MPSLILHICSLITSLTTLTIVVVQLRSSLKLDKHTILALNKFTSTMPPTRVFPNHTSNEIHGLVWMLCSNGHQHSLFKDDSNTQIEQLQICNNQLQTYSSQVLLCDIITKVGMPFCTRSFPSKKMTLLSCKFTMRTTQLFSNIKFYSKNFIICVGHSCRGCICILENETSALTWKVFSRYRYRIVFCLKLKSFSKSSWKSKNNNFKPRSWQIELIS